MPVDISDYIDLTEKRLDDLAVISESDVAMAKLWVHYASSELVKILNAEVLEDLAPNA